MNIISMFEESVVKYANNPLLMEKNNGEYVSTSYWDVHRNVRRFAAGLISLGVEENDHVAILSEGRNDWLISELSILYVHAVSIPLSYKLEVNTDLKFRLQHSESKFIIVSGNQLSKIRMLLKELPLVEQVIVLDLQTELQGREIDKMEVYGMGDVLLLDQEFLLNFRRSRIDDSDVATIIYTSGTSSDPKGVMLTHRNYISNVLQAASLKNIGDWQRTLAILPWDHAFAHTACLYVFIYFGSAIASPQLSSGLIEYLRNIPLNIKEIKPNILMFVPALAKNFRKSIESALRAKGELFYKFFCITLRIAYFYNGTGYDKGAGLKSLLTPLVRMFDSFLYNKVRQSFGGELNFIVGGGAYLDMETQKFYYAIGIPLMQGYGLTEASPIISSNIYEPYKHKLGSCGKFAKTLTVTIRDEKGKALPVGESGEIVISGDNIMLGYWKNRKSTLQVIKDGWLYTGDLGYLDEDGFLFVQGRFKSMLIGNDGEKYSPEAIEEFFMINSPYVEQCMLYNNQNPYTSMLVVPNRQTIAPALRATASKEDEDLYAKESIRLLMDSIFALKKNMKNDFPSRWLPSVVIILGEPFDENNRCLNSTMKMVRDKISVYFRSEIEFAYDVHAKDIYNQMNMTNIKRIMKSEKPKVST